MKKVICLAILMVFASCSSDVSLPEEPDNPTTGENPITPDPTPDPDPMPTGMDGDWNLVFEDNFDTDLAQWNIWDSGAFNNEIQLYRPEQLAIADGVLNINVQREAITGDTDPFNTAQKDFDYVSGRIETKTTFGPSDMEGEREYRFMARIRMPLGNGMWPAFWSFGDPWPTMGEIDIMEARGNNIYQSNLFFGEEPNVVLSRNEDTEAPHTLDVDLTADFHTFELIWGQDKMIINLDGELLHEYIADEKNFVTSFFGKKEQIVINAAVGGIFFQGIDPADFADSATMQVDWVRVYKR